MEQKPADFYLPRGSRKKTVPICCLPAEGWQKRLPFKAKGQTDWVVKWAETQQFKASPGEILQIPSANGGMEMILFGLGDESLDDNPYLIGRLASQCPPGCYHFAGGIDVPETVYLAWGLSQYKFERLKSTSGKADKKCACLLLGSEIDQAALISKVESHYWGRDLINRPANDLGPDQFEKEIRRFAKRNRFTVTVVKGDNLLEKNFPLVHAVGRASSDAPRLIDLRWGKKNAPKICLVGKGICFDTGGLNIKPGGAMLLMKKDMGGAATALTVASMIAGANLPVNLRVILPIAENAISGSAFRPGDVIPSRKGLSVEIGNTDAEGRLVLADGLALGDEEKPDYMFCFATLTGAARVAMGPDLPPFYTKDDEMAAAIETASRNCHDPLWRLPLWPRYDSLLKSAIADVNHIYESPFAGSITAALFLHRFVEHAKHFAHFDIFGWTPQALPGRPKGGEPQAAHAVFQFLENKFG